MIHGTHSVNTAWYIDVNNWARESSWAHGFMRIYSHDIAILLLALILVVAWLVARRSTDAPKAVARVLWAGGGTIVAWLVTDFELKPSIAEQRPYFVVSHVEVMFARTHEYSFPSGHATVAGAVIVGLFLARRQITAWFALVIGLLLCFGRVYTGMHYPFDVVAGFLFGGAVVAITWPIAVPVVHWATRSLSQSKLSSLVVAKGH